VNARLRYSVFRFAAAGFVLIEKVRLLLDEDERCTLDNLESGLGVSHITSVLDEIEEALRSLSESEATREFATVHIKHFREMRSSFIRFLTPENWDGSTWQQVCNEVEAKADLREAAASDRSLAGQYTQFMDGITSTVLKGFPEQLVNAEGLKLLPEMLQPFFSLAQKISELHRESQLIPLPEFNLAGQEYLFVKERIPELTDYVEACQRLQPELGRLFPVSIDHRTDPMWWLFDFRSRVQERLRELSLGAKSEAIADEKSAATSGDSRGRRASHSSSPSVNSKEAASAQDDPALDHSTSTESARPAEKTPDAEPAKGNVSEAKKDLNDSEEDNCDEFSWKRIEGGLCLCGVVVKLSSDLQEKVLARLCDADGDLSAKDLAKRGTDGDESDVDGIRRLLCSIRKQLRSAFKTKKNPIPTRRRNKPGQWYVNEELLVQRANDLQKAKCPPVTRKTK
jgi:hypothetical protein